MPPSYLPAVVEAFDVQSLIGTDHHRDAALVTLLLLFGTAASGFTYVVSFFFRSASTGQNVVLSA